MLYGLGTIPGKARRGAGRGLAAKECKLNVMQKAFSESQDDCGFAAHRERIIPRPARLT